MFPVSQFETFHLTVRGRGVEGGSFGTFRRPLMMRSSVFLTGLKHSLRFLMPYLL